MAKPRAPQAPASLRLPAFSGIVILSPGSEMQSAEAEMRLRTAARYLSGPKKPAVPAELSPNRQPVVPPVIRVAEIPASPAATAMALYRSFRAMGRGGPCLFLAAGNTTMGQPTLFTTDWGNTLLAPDDGTLDMVADLLNQRRIAYSRSPMNIDPILAFERMRMENPDYQPALDFTLRDVLAPAAALLLAGTAANEICQTDPTPTKASGRHLAHPFIRGMRSLTPRLGAETPFLAIRNDDGDLLTNLTLDGLGFEQMAEEKAVFTLQTGPRGNGLTRLFLPSSKVGMRTSATHVSEPHLALSSTLAPMWDERFLSLHLPTQVPAFADTLSGTIRRVR